MPHRVHNIIQFNKHAPKRQRPSQQADKDHKFIIPEQNRLRDLGSLARVLKSTFLVPQSRPDDGQRHRDREPDVKQFDQGQEVHSARGLFFPDEEVDEEEHSEAQSWEQQSDS
jgi:hypothetical protein